MKTCTAVPTVHYYKRKVVHLSNVKPPPHMYHHILSTPSRNCCSQTLKLLASCTVHVLNSTNCESKIKVLITHMHKFKQDDSTQVHPEFLTELLALIGYTALTQACTRMHTHTSCCQLKTVINAQNELQQP